MTNFNTSIVFRKKFIYVSYSALFIFLIIPGFIRFVLLENKIFTDLYFMYAFISFFILALFGKKIIKVFFSKEVYIKIDEAGIIFFEDKPQLIVWKAFYFEYLEFYSIQFPSNLLSTFELYLRGNGKGESFSLFNEGININYSETEDILNSLKKAVKDYNSNVLLSNQSEIINFKPSFMATKGGLILITFAIVFLMIAITIHVVNRQQSGILTLMMGSGLILNGILQRDKDLRYAKKLSNNND